MLQFAQHRVLVLQALPELVFLAQVLIDVGQGDQAKQGRAPFVLDGIGPCIYVARAIIALDPEGADIFLIVFDRLPKQAVILLGRSHARKRPPALSHDTRHRVSGQALKLEIGVDDGFGRQQLRHCNCYRNVVKKLFEAFSLKRVGEPGSSQNSFDPFGIVTFHTVLLR